MEISPRTRPAYFDGQRLSAGDLTAGQRYHRELRWLHNRSLHTWGIAAGLLVSGKRKDTSVRLGPGYALDCLGRELIVAEPRIIPVPPVSGADGTVPYYLTASYAADEDLAPDTTRAGVCVDSAGKAGAVRLPELARVRWQQPDDLEPDSRYRPGLDVILGTIAVVNCSLYAPVGLGQRRDARPDHQAQVSSGTSPAGQTSWEFWPAEGEALGVQAFVSTAPANFRATPHYQAHVLGERVLKDPTPNVSGSGWLVDGFPQVVDATAASFRLRVLLPRGSTGPVWQLNPDGAFVPQTLVTLRTTMAWRVAWMGLAG